MTDGIRPTPPPSVPDGPLPLSADERREIEKLEKDVKHAKIGRIALGVCTLSLGLIPAIFSKRYWNWVKEPFNFNIANVERVRMLHSKMEPGDPNIGFPTEVQGARSTIITTTTDTPEGKIQKSNRQRTEPQTLPVNTKFVGAENAPNPADFVPRLQTFDSWESMMKNHPALTDDTIAKAQIQVEFNDGKKYLVIKKNNIFFYLQDVNDASSIITKSAADFDAQLTKLNLLTATKVTEGQAFKYVKELHESGKLVGTTIAYHRGKNPYKLTVMSQTADGYKVKVEPNEIITPVRSNYLNISDISKMMGCADKTRTIGVNPVSTISITETHYATETNRVVYPSWQAMIADNPSLTDWELQLANVQVHFKNEPDDRTCKFEDIVNDSATYRFSDPDNEYNLRQVSASQLPTALRQVSVLRTTHISLPSTPETAIGTVKKLAKEKQLKGVSISYTENGKPVNYSIVNYNHKDAEVTIFESGKRTKMSFDELIAKIHNPLVPRLITLTKSEYPMEDHQSQGLLIKNSL